MSATIFVAGTLVVAGCNGLITSILPGLFTQATMAPATGREYTPQPVVSWTPHENGTRPVYGGEHEYWWTPSPSPSSSASPTPTPTTSPTPTPATDGIEAPMIYDLDNNENRFSFEQEGQTPGVVNIWFISFDGQSDYTVDFGTTFVSGVAAKGNDQWRARKVFGLVYDLNGRQVCVVATAKKTTRRVCGVLRPNGGYTRYKVEDWTTELVPTVVATTTPTPTPSATTTATQ